MLRLNRMTDYAIVVLGALAHRHGQTVASAQPRMHHGRRRRLADVVTAIRTSRTVEGLGRDALANGEQRLRSEAEMRRMLGPFQDAVDRTISLVQRLNFSLDELRYEYPSEIAEGESPTDRLARLARAGLRFDLPRFEPPAAPAAPGSDPDRPPKLR